MTSFPRIILAAATSAAVAIGATTAHSGSMLQASVSSVQQAIAEEQQDATMKRHMLRSLFKAQTALENKKSSEAKTHIQHVGEYLAQIDDKLSETSALADAYSDQPYNGRKAIEVSFGETDLTPEIAVMPIERGLLSVEDIEETILLQNLKSKKIERASVRYIAYDIEREEMKEQLNEAMEAIENQDFYSAQYDLLQIQRDILENNETLIAPRERAKDHLTLAQYLLKNDNREAARSALEEAKEVLFNDQNTSEADSQKNAKLHKLQKEIAQLSSRLGDETLIENVDDQFEEWLIELSS
jgi:hypothetical protein